MADPAVLISRKTGDWWQDDRRNYCAYCGVDVVPNNGPAKMPTSLTRDHVIPRAQALPGRSITIPCCKACNAKKGKTGLPEFMLTPYFAKIRARERPHRWSMRDLWLVMAMAAVEQARHQEAWTVETTEATPAKATKPAQAPAQKSSPAVVKPSGGPLSR